ncbi:MAG: ABC transporter substrate-binding protein, partial [Actinomycetota bacterium]
MITACNNSRLHGRTAVPFRARLLAAFLGLALVAAGCGDDEADDASASASASVTADASASATDTADEADENADTAQATDDGSSGDGSADGGEDGDAAAAGYYPVTIEHDLGSTTIPAAPVRVLAMTDQGELAALLAMGIKPIAYGQRVPGEIEYLAAAGAYDPEIEIFEGNAEINFEQLVTFQPDLIVGQIGFITPENIETYQEIAPTVPIGFDDWQQGLLDIGAIFDDVDTAEAKIAELEGLIADFPSRVPFAEGRSVSVALGFPGFGIYQLTNASILGGLLESAGAAPLPEPTNEQ